MIDSFNHGETPIYHVIQKIYQNDIVGYRTYELSTFTTVC